MKVHLSIFFVLMAALWCLAGFECTYRTGGDGDVDADGDGDGDILGQEGASCREAVDFPEASRCSSSSTVLVCNKLDVVEAWDCAALCEGGTCGSSSELGHDFCLCADCGFHRGCACDPRADASSSTCDGDELTSCDPRGFVVSVSCSALCAHDYGEGTLGTCAFLPETEANGCACELEGCDFSSYCADTLWRVSCDDDLRVRTNCNLDCQLRGMTSGVCHQDDCICG